MTVAGLHDKPHQSQPENCDTPSASWCSRDLHRVLLHWQHYLELDGPSRTCAATTGLRLDYSLRIVYVSERTDDVRARCL